MNERGLQHMLGSKFKLGADAARSAGPVGRNAQAATDASMHAEFLTYSRSRGLFAGLDLDGTVLSQDGDDMREFYGANIPYQSGNFRGDTLTPGIQHVRLFVRWHIILCRRAPRSKHICRHSGPPSGGPFVLRSSPVAPNSYLIQKPGLPGYT